MKPRQPSWPPTAHSCQECGFSTALVTDLLDHMRIEHAEGQVK